MSLKGTVWAPIGPSPINESGVQDNGLVTAIAVSPTNPNVIYLGTAGGGVWRSFDGGANWIPLSDRQLSLAIGEPGALAIDPTNTNVIYAGTSGRLIFRTFSSITATFTPVQAGIYKSADGGASWILLGSRIPANNSGNANQFAGQQCNVIIVDPANGKIVYLASDNGIFISADGGQNWTQGAGVGGDAQSMVLDTSSPTGSRILYAGITGQGVFRSGDGGGNWNAILSGATPVLANALCAAPPCIPTRGFGRFSVALAPPVSPPNAAGVQVLYATMEGTPVNGLPTDAPNPVGVFLSTDQGTTWNQRTAAAMPPVTYGGYCLHIAVDPASPGNGNNDILYIGNRDQAVSIDSGNTFTAISGVHSDTHAWAFIPQPGASSSIVLCGTDGGLVRSSDTGATWTTLNTGGLQTSLFYNIDVRPDPTASVTVGALQDNSLETTSGGSGLGWQAGGADGFAIAYDGTIAGQVYGCENSGTAPQTRILRSTDDGVSFPTDITPWGTTSDQGGPPPSPYIAPIATDPSTGGIVYALGNQNLWQSQAGGNPGSWRIIFPNVGGGGNDIDVAPTNGNSVVLAVGSRVFVSTNALAATVGPPSGVTFAEIKGLPGRNVARVAFDPVDPTTIYAVLGGLNGGGSGNGHVFRATVASLSWTDLSPPLDIPFSALALDGSDTPTTLYAGTEFGVLRSVDLGSSWSILDDIHFPHVPVMDLALRNGVLRAGTYGRGVFEFAVPSGPVVAVSLEDNLVFGTLCKGPAYLTLKVFNVGMKDLVITSVQRLMGSAAFAVLSTPGTPLILAAGEEIEFTVRYAPTAAGIPDVAVIRINSNDAMAPFVDVTAMGSLGAGKVATAIPDSGDFGDVCLGTLADELLTINNPGDCPLSISNVTSSSADFQVPGVLSYPLRVNPGGSIDVAIRFRPSSFGAKSGTIRILSDDPAGPHSVRVSGTAPAPRMSLILADTGDFGKICVGSFVDRPLVLNNSGKCTLTVTGIVSSAADFIVPDVSSFPNAIGPGDSLSLPIRFAPTSLGAQSATITVNSDDPVGPRTLTVSGFAPSGKLAVSGSTTFGGVTACCCADRTLSICNTGDCALHVTSVRFKRKSHHWKLLHNPFPATLHAGSCLDLVVRYKATEKCPRCCELIIESDDPDTPVKTLEMLAYAIWDPCGCKACCDDCSKGCCSKVHHASCCRQGYPCCDDDNCDDDD